MNWKALLKRMKLEHIKAKAPGFFDLSGGYTMQVKPYTDKTANGLTRCIEDFINNLPNGVGEATRQNSTGTPRQRPDGTIKWSKSNTRLGVSDIRGTYKGRALNIEVKIGRDTQSDAQKKEMERVRAAGGIYWIVTTFDDFLSQWIDAGFEVPCSLNEEEMKAEYKKIIQRLGSLKPSQKDYKQQLQILTTDLNYIELNHVIQAK